MHLFNALPLLLFHCFVISGKAFTICTATTSRTSPTTRRNVLSSDQYLEHDLVAIRIGTSGDDLQPRLCVVRSEGTVLPLCRHEDDVETDLFLDPRQVQTAKNEPMNWDEVMDEDVVGTYGEGWYGQRPVPSLGGGPGYGAEASEIWSIDEATLTQLLEEDGIDVPILDVGMAHGEKARAGAF